MTIERPSERAVRAGLRGILAEATRRLELARVPSPDVDAQLLVGHVLGLSRGEVQARVVTGSGIEADAVAAIERAIARRAAREPLQHITGVAHFRGLELEVGPGVFVPRPETEEVARLAIEELIAQPGAPVAVDLGTGSGAIALSLAAEAPTAQVVAVENSAAAFVWAKGNAKRTGLDNIRMVFADLADCLPDIVGSAAVVVSNPPYIPIGMVPRDPEVRRFDPEAALYGGGADGLDEVRAVARTAWRMLRPGGLVVIEHAEVQEASVQRVLVDAGFADVVGHLDLTGRPRATTGRR